MAEPFAPSALTGDRNIAQNGANQKDSPTLTVAMSGAAMALMRAETTASVRTLTREMRKPVKMFTEAPMIT